MDDSVYGRNGASPKVTHLMRKTAPCHDRNFSEGTFYKQVVSFQSARGKIFNDRAIVKNSINQVQREQAQNRTKVDFMAASKHSNSIGNTP